MQPMNNNNYNHFISEVALTSCGFEQATLSSTPKEIWNIHPHGGTAMRDALLYGSNLMLKLHDLLEKEHTASSWSFLHILITDGHDTDSNASYEQATQMLSTLKGDMNVRDLKIIILGVDIEYTYAQQLRNLAASAGIHGEYHDITHTDLTHMFHKIRTNFGMGTNPYDQNPQNNEELTQEYYAVLFTLDISGSMAGHKWDVTRHAVVDFLRYLGPNDIVSAIVFNDHPHLVMHWNTKQNQMRMGQMSTNQPFGQIMASQGFYDPNEFGGNGNENYDPYAKPFSPGYSGQRRRDSAMETCCQIM